MLIILSVILSVALCFGVVTLLTKLNEWNDNRIIGPVPVPGETWRYKTRKDPWSLYTRYLIIDVLEGWVKYQMPHGSMCTDKLCYFTRHHEKMTPEAIAAEPLPTDPQPDIV